MIAPFFRFLPTAGLFFLLLLSQITMGQEVNRQALNEGWTLRATDFPRAEALSTSVPGSVQEVLIRSGLTPDPYYGTNETEVQWIGDRNWEYNLYFEQPLDPKRSYRLNFTGLDTYAKVYLNDRLLFTADNMFRSWTANIDTVLKDGTNHLRVAFTAPRAALKEQIENFPYAINQTATNDTGNPRIANFARKAQFQFGWDWGLRLVTQGIWRPVYLESWEHARLEEVQYVQQEVRRKVARLRAQVKIDRNGPGNYELKLRDGVTGRLYAKRGLLPSEKEVDFLFQIDQPRLWWPNGHGEPHRYALICELWRDDQQLDQWEQKIGIRTVELIQQPDAYGNSFYFKINGRPIFTKGASYIPQDALLTRISPAQKTELLTRAKNAHFNLIRVWGGGIYEDRHFYEQCDSLGLMVWQDFMFACAAYPAFPEFLTNVEAEVRENIRRLRNHPSIIVWCGNNEVNLAMRNWGWQKQYDIQGPNEEDMFRSYRQVFEELIPEVLSQEDPARPYTHTTPLYSYTNPEDRGLGTLHYWGVWHGPDDFSGYETKVGRYMNEYGFQSFPDMETIANFADSSQWSLDSTVMAHHQKSYIGNGLIKKFTEQYGEPTSDFAAFVQQSQQVQYEGIRRAILSHRLRYGYCMGTTFWQLNDCWPAPSWSAIDYYGRSKVLFDELPNLYAPIVAAAVGDPKLPQLAIISDFPGGTEVVLRWAKRSQAAKQVLSSGEKKLVVLRPGTQLLDPPAGMVPEKEEETEVKLYIGEELHSTFKWSGRQLPIQLPEEKDWLSFPDLVKE